MKKNALQLPLQTFTLVVGFMVWVILSGLISYIKKDITLTTNQLTLVTAVPVILGSVLRVPDWVLDEPIWSKNSKFN